MKRNCETRGSDGEGGFKHRLSIARSDFRYHSKRRQWVALARVMWTTLVLKHFGETCQECGRRYCWTVWHAPDWLWLELIGKHSGLLCPRCFDDKASAAGYRLYWKPDAEYRIAGEVVTANPPEDWWVTQAVKWADETGGEDGADVRKVLAAHWPNMFSVLDGRPLWTEGEHGSRCACGAYSIGHGELINQGSYSHAIAGCVTPEPSTI